MLAERIHVNNGNWLEKASKKAKLQAKTAFLQEHAIALDPDTYAGSDEELAALSVWHRTATTKTALHLSPTGAAILPKSIVAHGALPRVPGWRKILKEIGRAHGDASRHAKCLAGHVADLLYGVEFQHHQSTNGRWNADLCRWERYGVRSVEDWRYHNHVPQKDKQFYSPVPRRTFFRIKDRLIAMGLIEAGSHLWRGRTYLWMKPTDELSRILFEPEYWEEVRAKYIPAKPVKTKPTSTRKPRGISARHCELDAELLALYRKAISNGFNYPVECSKQERWAVWDRLTKPIALGNGYAKAPFAVKGTYRYSRIYEGLGLAWG
jgi:hypothetical protein